LAPLLAILFLSPVVFSILTNTIDDEAPGELPVSNDITIERIHWAGSLVLEALTLRGLIET
jgi:hypothetical protein